jgi:ATP-dependent protease Clp ATPase subunit
MARLNVVAFTRLLLGITAFASLGSPMADESALRCCFCDKSQHEIERLVAGPAVFMCNRCLARAVEALTAAPFKAVALQVATAREPFCAFCGKSAKEIALAGTGQANICAECTLKTLEIMLESVRPAPEPRQM